MAGSVAMYAVVGEVVGNSHPTAGTVFHALSLVSIIIVGAILVVRRTLVLLPERLLAEHPGDTTTLSRWKEGYLFLYALCETLGLFGLVLRLIGFSFTHVWGFYLSAFALLLLFSPRVPRAELS